MRKLSFPGPFTASAALAGLAALHCASDPANAGFSGEATTMDPSTADPTTDSAVTAGSGTGGSITGGSITGVNLPTGDTTDGVDPEDACVGVSAGATPAPAILQFVVDTSGSMGLPPGETPGGMSEGAPTKWTITRDALLLAIDGLSSITAVGLSYFPGLPPGPSVTCIADEVAVSIEPLGGSGSAQRYVLISSLNEFVPVGDTPTHAAIKQGVETLQAYQSAGDKFVVLITDGSPSRDLQCGRISQATLDVAALQPIIDEAAAAAENGVRTFVIGSPGSEDAKEVLSRIASVGGTARAGCSDAGPDYCHFDMTTQPDFAAALQQALSAVAGQVASCEFEIPAPPNGEVLDLSSVNVNIIDSAGVSQSLVKAPAGGGCPEGWDYSPDRSRVVLCPSTCETYKAMPSASVAVEFGCVTVEIPK